MRSLILLLVSLLFIVSCKNKSSIIADKLIDIDFNKEYHDLQLRSSDFFSEVKYVNLDNMIQIGRVSDIRITRNGIYILDKANHQILVYDYSGTIVNYLNHRGRGPGEYLSLDQFDVDEDSGNISILDISSRKVLIYSPEGEYIYSFTIDSIARDFARLNNGSYVFYTPDYMEGMRYGIWQTDSLGVFNKEIMNINDHFKFSSGIYPKYFHHLGDIVYVKGREDNNALYHIETDSIRIPYQLRTDIKIPYTARISDKPVLDQYIGEVCLIHEYLETNKLCLIKMTNLEKSITILYDKAHDKEYILTNQDTIIDDMPWAGVYMTTTEDCFIGIILPEWIDANPALSEQFANANMNSSPIITFSYVK